MKYYSDLLKEFFDTEEECIDAEGALLEEENQKALDKERLEALITEASDEITSAQENYDKALSDVRELAKKYVNDVKEIIEPAREALAKAKDTRKKLIIEYNKKYGVYRTTKFITEDNYDEVERFLSDIFGDIFK